MADLQYLKSAERQFLYYKKLGEDAMLQMEDKALFWQPNAESNSVTTIIKHLKGNMISRWTDFLTTDGEKPWRGRDAEFENDIRRECQMDGIAKAKNRGVKFGRKR